MASTSIKPLFICGNDEFQNRLLSLKLTGSFSNTEYISAMTKPATVMTILPYRGRDMDCSPLSKCQSNSYMPKEIDGVLLTCKTLEQRQEYHYNSPRRIPMPVTVFLDNGIAVEADTYVYPVDSIEQEFCDDWEFRAYVSSDRPYSISCTSPEEPMINIPLMEDENLTKDGAANEDYALLSNIVKLFQRICGLD
ncbi:hypothetical protein IL306_009848 [Fusarium sp. DS 682]|nr:hypothetical protein IL306_009848 [Fusarium sp. DS 682]